MGREVNRKRNQLVAEHAAAELATRGIWACQCPSCKEARADTIMAASKGYCKNCGDIIRRPRKSALFCCNSCRSGYFNRNKRSESKLSRTLF